MEHVIVKVLGGGVLVYKRGSQFRISEGWLEVLGPSRTPIAAFPRERVSRCFYAGSETDHHGIDVERAVGL